MNADWQDLKKQMITAIVIALIAIYFLLIKNGIIS